MEQIKVSMQQQGLTMEADREQVAMALKTWRLRKGLTQQQVGDLFGMSRYTILRIEGAKPVTWEMAYKVFAKLAAALEKETRETT